MKTHKTSIFGPWQVDARTARKEAKFAERVKNMTFSQLTIAILKAYPSSPKQQYLEAERLRRFEKRERD